MKNIPIPKVLLGSYLANLVVELETLKNKDLHMTTNVLVFNQLKDLLNRLEMLGSARIEGNNTTVMEYIEKRQSMEDETGDDEKISESIQEILNIENALRYCEESLRLGKKINRSFVSDVHKIVVQGLKREGSIDPGNYRKINLSINKSKVQLSDFTQIDSDMEELFAFVDNDKNISNAMLKDAIAHHVYVLIHPFDNGNGRTARIFTYACLLRDGFSLVEKVINPTAVFCSNRNMYYDMLAIADTQTPEGIETWCRYVLDGVRDEFLKISKLTQENFVKEFVIKPCVEFSKIRGIISDKEYDILKVFFHSIEIGTSDLSSIIPNMSKSRYSQIFKEMKDRKLVVESSRGLYVINLNGPLIRGVVKALDVINFLPVQDESTENM